MIFAIRSFFALAITFLVAAVNAAPPSQEPVSTIANKCTNVSVYSPGGNWLVADCLTGSAKAARIASATFLTSKVRKDPVSIVHVSGS